MDLFNPPKLYNFIRMNHNLQIDNLENPYVQVVWEDTPENFTQEKIKTVKQYFQKKYRSNNVNVITKIKTIADDIIQSIDVSVNIMEKNYQIELIKNFLKSKNYDSYIDKVLEIDNIVENRIISTTEEVATFKKWYIKKIEFSNFLSYGENQVIDFDKCDGIVVVESDPPNFGGKTVLTVDLLMFLFFNTTTKTTKAEEVFNRFTNKDKVSVKGEIIIDGEEYIIVRNIERKKSKSGEWNVKTELDFFKKLADGTLLNFTGEQRRETENYIKNSIGEQEDFLMTILTTATNLEDLIDSKPTARGQVLSKFLGLDFLKKKEEFGKEIYSEFSKGMLSNVYNTESLSQEIDDLETKIIQYQHEVETVTKELVETNEKLKKGNDYKDSIIGMKYTDIDQELIILKPEVVTQEISKVEESNKSLSNQIDNINVVEPTSFYHENEHDDIKSKWGEKYKEKLSIEQKLKDIKDLKNSVTNGIKCGHCGIELMNAEITKNKISEETQLNEKLTEVNTNLESLSEQERGFLNLKKEFDEYEKNKLVKSRLELTIDTNNLKKSKLEDTLKKYHEVQEKIKKNNQLDQQLLKTNMRISELEQQKKEFEKTITSNNIYIDNFRNKIKINTDYIKKIKEEFEKEKIYKIYLEIFGKNGISKLIMKTMMPIINSELQRLLQDSCYFRLEVRISDKNEVEFWMIDNSSGIEKLMASGSGYERTIASLALRAVLAKVSSLPKPNIIVFDEVFGKISNDNLDLVSEFFVKIKEYFEKIFVITHNPLINNWADSMVKITKKENISQVSQNTTIN
jgi:DNA repair exonuclease SbcCD ATPase subunit